MKLHKLAAIILATAPAILAAPAAAQGDFPNKQLRILVGFPAGGSTDVLARVLSQETRKALGQDMLVINKGGAAGSLAISELISAPADGYTIAITPSSVLTVAHHFQSVRPDMLESTDGLLMAARQRAGVMISSKSPLRSFKDFVNEAKANPGKLSIGMIGAGTTGAILLKAVLMQDNLDVNLVPLNGDAPVTNAVLAQHVTAGMGSAAAFSEHIRAGTMRLLASGEATRIDVAPDVPSFMEMGYPYKGNAIQYLLAPKGLPPAVRQKLITVFADAMKSPAYIEIAKKNELYDPTVLTGADLDTYLIQDRAEIATLIEKLGLGKK